jgi:hypothetical protein
MPAVSRPSVVFVAGEKNPDYLTAFMDAYVVALRKQQAFNPSP